MRHLLSHLNHQETTMTRPGLSDRCARVGGAKASESAPHVGVGLYRADFYIRSIVTHHETSAEPSRSSEDDADASRSHPTGAMVP